MTGQTTELVRTRGGTVIHKATCRHNVNSISWQWAEGRAHAEIRVSASMRGLKLCGVCKPADGAGVVGENR